MLPEIAHVSLLIALCLSLLLATVPLVGSFHNDTAMMRMDRPFTLAIGFFSTLSFVLLVTCFMQDDFSVRIVAQHSNSALPDFFKMTAVWGGHEGSLFLWVEILSLWMVAVALFSKEIPADMRARVLAVMGMVAIGFLLFLLLTSNPFERVLPNIPADGRDLNPLLQDIGMVIHPPMLYFGYVGFSVAFAFAIAALLGGEFDAAWVRWTRPWTAAAWGFLTLGIAIGSWWAYYELGWGGWWFWDPVENASFMPWLVGTALMHSLAVTEQRGLFKSWTILLAIFAFSLSLLGTFLVRSGVLTSVHSFAADPTRGVFILAFLAIVIGGSLTLFALRAPTVASSGNFSFFSREMFLLVNNVLLVVATLTILAGTLFPLVADMLEIGKYSVGAPYFNTVFAPIMLALLALLGIGPLLRWKQTRAGQVRSTVLFMVPVASLLAIVFIVAYGEGFHPASIVAFLVAGWVLSGMMLDLRNKVRHASSVAAGLRRLPLSWYGMQLAHTGLVVTAVGIAIVSGFQQERDIRMAVGDRAEVHGYEVHFVGSREVPGANFLAAQGEFVIRANGEPVTTLYPEKRSYLSQRGNMMTEAAIDPSLARDLFIALGEPLADGAWAVRLQYKPFIRLIWLGCLLMAAGALLAILDKRYR